MVRRVKDSDWTGFPSQIQRKEKRSPLEDVPLLYDYNGNSRGVGIADVAYTIQSRRKHRVNGQMAYHVLEAMYGFVKSAQ